MSRSPALKWVGLALLGLAIAIAVAIVAGNLASQQIGISSESIHAGDALVPATAREHRDHRDRHGSDGETTTPREAPPPRQEPAPSEPEPVPGEAEPPETSTPHESRSESGDDHGSGGHGADD